MVTALIALHDLGAERPPRELAAPARSTSSSRRCTGPRRSPSPSSCSPAVEDAARPGARTRSRSASWTRSGAPRVNLKACIRAARERVVFINTGFLDRTGDEIHTSMEAGPDDPQGRHEAAAPGSWPTRTGTSTSASPAACRPGADRQGHVGDARPDGGDAGRRRSAIRKAGANTAWVPSPTAATLHAMHYHQVDVARRAGER